MRSGQQNDDMRADAREVQMPRSKAYVDYVSGLFLQPR
jgi:hypothetical protein